MPTNRVSTSCVLCVSREVFLCARPHIHATHIPKRNPEEAEQPRNCVIPEPTCQPEVLFHTIRRREFYLLSIYLFTYLPTLPTPLSARVLSEVSLPCKTIICFPSVWLEEVKCEYPIDRKKFSPYKQSNLRFFVLVLFPRFGRTRV